MDRDFETLFETIRESCSRPTWSRGVELARAEAVSGERDDGDEVRLRVAGREGIVPRHVTLMPEDEDWDCTCGGPDSPCEHVAAAVIALRQARRKGLALPAPARPGGRIHYRLTRAPGERLLLERDVVEGERVERLTTTLTALVSGRVDGPRVDASARDLAVETVLGTRFRGEVPRGVWPRLLDALEGCETVTLDGEAVRTSSERLRPRVVLEDHERGFLLRLVPASAGARAVAGEVFLCGDTLRAAGELGLTGREIQELRGGKRIPWDEAARLSTEILPALEQRIAVEVRTRRLPRIQRGMAPRLEVAVEREGEDLVALPLLIYGDPPQARVDADRLVHLAGALPERDRPAERRLLRHLQSELGLAPGHRLRLRGEEALETAERLRAFRGQVRGEALADFVRLPPLEPALEIEGEHLDLRFESPGDPGPRTADPARVLAAWRAGESVVALEGGGFAPLPADWLARLGDRVADLLAARDARGRVSRFALPDLAALCEEEGLAPPPGLAALAPLLEDGLPQAALPGDLRATLRPYQREGVDWLAFLRDAGLGALLADDMGLGKTLQALCALRGRSLVVAPTSLLHSWRDEAARFRPGLRVAVYHGPGRRLDPDAGITLTTYALLRLDRKALGEVEWDAVVLDEAQAIKNPDSQAARAAFALPARWRLALSGTPVENRLEELWSLMHFANPGLLGTRRDFQERVAGPVAEGRPEAAERLRRRVRPFLLRRLKRDVARDLPPRSEVTLYCVLSEEERRIYDAIQAATRRDVVEQLARGGSVMAALEALLRLRQAACHPGLVPGQEATGSSKLGLLLERLEEAAADGHKALVFSQWTSFLDRVEGPLGEAGLAFLRLDGSTRDRAGVVSAFQDEEGPPVLLASLQAGGTGLTLTAADHVFLLDPWWNPAVEDQAADRAHRIGQTRPVLVHRLIAENTVEERILALQAHKRGLSELAISESDPAGALSREDLLELLA